MSIDSTYIELVPKNGRAYYTWWRSIPRVGYTEYIEKYWPATERIGWGSHQPVLLHILNTIPTGKVFEFGMGFGSTPLMSIVCANQGRKLVSIENNRKWFVMFRHYTWGVQFIFKDNILIQKNYKFFNSHYSIAFVDAHPAPLRQFFIDAMFDNVDYFVVHDTEAWFNKEEDPYHYDFSKFKHVLQFKNVHPMTTVLSNLDTIDNRLLDVVEYV